MDGYTLGGLVEHSKFSQRQDSVYNLATPDQLANANMPWTSQCILDFQGPISTGTDQNASGCTCLVLSITELNRPQSLEISCDDVASICQWTHMHTYLYSTYIILVPDNIMERLPTYIDYFFSPESATILPSSHIATSIDQNSSFTPLIIVEHFSFELHQNNIKLIKTTLVGLPTVPTIVTDTSAWTDKTRTHRCF